MIRQETTPELVNRVSNTPGVRGNICYHGGPMDWAPAFPSDATGVVVLSNGEDACGVFERTGDRAWQAHTLFAASCRGARALAAGRAMVDHMRPIAALLWGATPVGNRAARWFNRQLGFVSKGFDVFAAEGAVEIFERELG